MNRLFILIALLYSASTSIAQTTQWASKVVAFSSQFGDKDYSANQVLGVPNAIFNTRLTQMAWVPKKEASNTGEFIRVEFKQAMSIQQVAVAESLNAGAIARIYLFDTNGKKYKIYENKNPKFAGQKQLFRHTFDRTGYKVKELKLELNTKAIEGSNQIDAIAISSSSVPIKAKEIDVLEYESDVEKAERLSVQVNSTVPERLPIISPDGQTLYFARKYHPQNIGEENHDDIWVAFREPDFSWSRAVNIGPPLNDKDHNFVVSMNPAGDILYLANDYRSNAKDGISVSYKKGRVWTRPKTLKIKNHYNDNKFVNYHVNIDGNIILMSVERKEGFGERDLYVSFKGSNEEWSEPKNMGSTINSVASENSVFLAADGKTIYFSSNGHPGYGGYDMFMSRRKDDTWTNWTKPQNLGPNINTKHNDYNYTIPASGEYAYFASDNTQGMSDLYRIRLPKEIQPEPVTLITGRIIDAETQQPISAKLKYQQLDNENDNRSLNAKEDGEYQLILPFGEDIGMYAEVDGYFSVSENMELSGLELEVLDSDGDPASFQSNSSKKTTDPEIEKLQLSLNKLNKEIGTIEKKRNKTSDLQSSNPPNRKLHRSDPELNALKKQYIKILKEEKEEKDETSVTNSSTSNSDVELDAMKKKFKKHHTPNNNAPSSVMNPEDPTEDQELSDMKKRFEKFKKKETTETPPKTDSSITNPSSATSPNNEQDLTDEAFEQYKQEVQDDLEKEFSNQIKLELFKALFDDLAKEQEQALDNHTKKRFRNTIKEDVRKNFEEDITQQIRKDIKKVISTNEEDEIVSKIKQDIRKTIKEEVQEDLRSELREPLEKEINREFDYLLKKDKEKQLRKTLEEKIETQIQEEKKKTNTTTPIQTVKPKPLLTENLKYQELEMDILLLPIKVGQVIPMNNVFFDANKASLKNLSNTELNRVVDFLKKNTNLVIEVGGHSNGWCSHDFANQLSHDRAKEVANYFIQKGIPNKRIQYHGYGKTKPIASNETLEGRKKNQRVELKIIELLD